MIASIPLLYILILRHGLSSNHFEPLEYILVYFCYDSLLLIIL